MKATIVLAIAAAIAIGGQAYAQSFRFGAPAFQNPRIVAGQVSSGGQILKGSGFTARYLGSGEYEVRFQRSLFPDGCPVMTVTNVNNETNPPVNEVFQSACNRTFQVRFFPPGNTTGAAQSFNFVAAATE
jgi:hypothetical protein